MDHGTSDLDAEKVDTVELVYAQDVSNLLQATLTLFYWRFSDLVSFDMEGPGWV